MHVFSLLILFIFLENSFKNTIRMLNSVEQYLGPNCFKGYQKMQKLSLVWKEFQIYKSEKDILHNCSQKQTFASVCSKAVVLLFMIYCYSYFHCY